MFQRVRKMGLVLLVCMLCLLPQDSNGGGMHLTMGGTTVLSIHGSGKDYLKKAAAASGLVIAGSIAGPGAVFLGAGLFFGAKSIVHGLGDVIGQADAAGKDLEDHASALAAIQEQNVAYLVREGVLQSSDILQERTADLAELSSARIFDAQVAALGTTATVESGFERILILLLGCLVAAFVAAATLLRSRGAVPLWRAGLEAALVGTVVVVLAFPLLPRALALTGLKNPAQQFYADLAKHKASFEKAMVSLKFEDAVTESLALQAYDPLNQDYLAEYQKAKLLRTLFVPPLRLPDADQAADILRQVTDVTDSQEVRDSDQTSVNATPGLDSELTKKSPPAETPNVTNDIPDPDLLTVIAYLTAATAKNRAGDAFAGIMASSALQSNKKRPWVLSPLAKLIVHNFCTLPVPSPATIATAPRLANMVPSQTPEHAAPDPCGSTVPPTDSGDGKKDIFTSLRISSTDSDELFQQTTVAFTTFLRNWFECMLPNTYSKSCLPNPSLHRDSNQSTQMVGTLLKDLQQKVIKPWNETFSTVVVNNNDAALAAHFSRLDDSVYIRAQEYAILLGRVQNDLSANHTLSEPAIAPLSYDVTNTTKQYFIFIPTSAPQPGELQLHFDFTNLPYPNDDKSSLYNVCTVDQPATGDGKTLHAVSIHSRWYACYVPGIGRDLSNAGAAALEDLLLRRLGKRLRAIEAMETAYQKIVKAEEGMPLNEQWGTLWSTDFVPNAVLLNLYASINEAGESKCGTTVGSFACIEQAWANEHGFKSKLLNPADKNGGLPDEESVQDQIARSLSAQIL